MLAGRSRSVIGSRSGISGLKMSRRDEFKKSFGLAVGGDIWARAGVSAGNVVSHDTVLFLVSPNVNI